MRALHRVSPPRVRPKTQRDVATDSERADDGMARGRESAIRKDRAHVTIVQSAPARGRIQSEPVIMGGHVLEKRSGADIAHARPVRSFNVAMSRHERRTVVETNVRGVVE